MTIARTSRLVGVAALTFATVALAGCSSTTAGTSAGAPATSTASAAASGPFEYKDARGTEVSLKTTPKTVVAQSSVAAALWDAGYHVAGVYGELTPDAAGTLSYQAGSLDTTGLTVVGRTYGEFDTEKYALAKPDLLVDYSFDDKTLWYVPAAQADQILALAPSVAVPGNYTNTDVAISTFVDLAGKLGADTSSATLTAEKKDYEAALAKVSTAASSGSTSGSSKLKVVVMSPGTDSLYVANPAYLPELSSLESAGVDLMDPVDAAKDVFTQYSWEEASKFADADVILVDARTYDSSRADLAKISTWANLPAVKAGQVYSWYAAAPYSYKAYATIYSDYAKDLTDAKKL